jgi:hypothetical protein
MSESALRSRARRLGLAVKKSRGGVSLDNQGGFMIVDADSNFVLAGERFDLSLDDVAEFLSDWER